MTLPPRLRHKWPLHKKVDLIITGRKARFFRGTLNKFPVDREPAQSCDAGTGKIKGLLPFFQSQKWPVAFNQRFNGLKVVELCYKQARSR